MGYTSVRDVTGAVSAAAALARKAAGPVQTGPDGVVVGLPLLVDQVAAEAGVHEPTVCARALLQANGDTARAVSLLRAWAATLPRLGSSRAAVAEVRAVRRITPGFREPPAGQYLGPSLDYESRLLDLDDPPGATGPAASGNGNGAGALPDAHGRRAKTPPVPHPFPRSLEGLDARGLVAPAEPLASPVDRTRHSAGAGDDRGAFQQLLGRAETGAMTAMAYAGLRGSATRADPTLVELRTGGLPVRVTHPESGGEVVLGEVEITMAEVALYAVHDGTPDARLTVGFGATVGRVERRAVAAAMLDGGCARAVPGGHGRPAPPEDREFLGIVLDGQEATGFVEHLKLPHHVTFTADLDRIQAVRAGGMAGDDEERS